MSETGSLIALVIDSDAAVRANFIERLQTHSIRGIEAENGLEALQQMEIHPVDFVISDVRMKKMDGIQFIEIVHRNHNDIPVVVTIDSRKEAAAIDAFRAGAVNVIKKDGRSEEFEKIVLPLTELIEKRKTQTFDFDSVRYFTEEISIGNDPALIPVTVDHLLSMLDDSKYADRLTGLQAVLYEMITNAIEHGNLAITSQEKEQALAGNQYDALLAEKRNYPLYKNRLVRIILNYHPGQLTISISDEGNGFRVDNFVTTTEENLLAQSGRGILLSRMYCDEIRYNEKGNKVTLIVKPGNEPAQERVVHTRPQEDAPPHILIVDNNPQILRHISKLLREVGYTFGYIAHAHHLFPRLEEELFDLILLDLNLPKTDGVRLLKDLQGHTLFRRIPVIMLTSDRNDRLMAECFANGVEDFIVKPVNKLALQSRINSTLSKRKSFQELGKANNQLEQLNTQLQHQYDMLTQTQQELKTEHKRIEEDIRLARRIQRNILAPELDLAFVKTSIVFQPHSIVSGDFHFQECDQAGNVNIFLGDATGHGISAAFLTMLVRMALGMTDSQLKPDAIVKSLNRQMADCVPRGDHMTGVMLKIAPDGLLQGCSAGGPPGLIISDDKPDQMIGAKGGQALGMFHRERVPFELESYQLQAGDKILLFTDGMLEWRNQADQAFGMEGVKDCLAGYRNQSIEQILQKLTEKVRQFAGDITQTDDMTLFGIQYKKP